MLSRGDDIVPIPGTKRRQTLEQNLGAVSVRLSPDHIRLIDERLPPGSTSGERYADMTEINPVVARKSG